MATNPPPRPHRGIDPRGPRFSQAITGIVLVAAFLLEESWSGAVWLVPAIGLVLGFGAVLGPQWSLFGRLWGGVVRPVLGIKLPAKLKDPAPPQFAQTLGFLFLTAATIALLGLSEGLGRLLIGWGLALIVAALALLAAITDLCVGCEIYTLGKKFLAARRRGSSG